MKILYVVPELDPNAGGGIATFYRHLLPAMSRLGHQIEVCVTNPFGCQTGPSDMPGVSVRTPDKDHFCAECTPASSTKLSTSDIPLVSSYLDDSWSTLEAEADLIDRWFGTEISKLFGENP